MARKPNYEFERRERERQRAEKKALRTAAKKEKKAQAEGSDQPDEGGENTDGTTPSEG